MEVGPVNPVASSTPKLGISGVNAQEAQIVIHRHKANGLGPYFVLAKSRSDTNDKTIIQNGDTLGTISDGTNSATCEISISADNGSNNYTLCKALVIQVVMEMKDFI